MYFMQQPHFVDSDLDTFKSYAAGWKLMFLIEYCDILQIDLAFSPKTILSTVKAWKE